MISTEAILVDVIATHVAMELRSLERRRIITYIRHNFEMVTIFSIHLVSDNKIWRNLAIDAHNVDFGPVSVGYEDPDLLIKILAMIRQWILDSPNGKNLQRYFE